jgi:hypothetical protein
MRFISFSFIFSLAYMMVFPFIYHTNNQFIKTTYRSFSGIDISSSEFPPNGEGQYTLHKNMIDSEIELLKEKYPELKNDYISYKFLFTPKLGSKQFFESDGSPFILIKIYSKNTKPGDMITISEVKYKDPADSNMVWKNFGTTLLFVFE